MSIIYIVADQDRPYILLFQGTLEEVAQALAAQPDPHELMVYANTDSFSRDLTPDEQNELHNASDV